MMHGLLLLYGFSIFGVSFVFIYVLKRFAHSMSVISDTPRKQFNAFLLYYCVPGTHCSPRHVVGCFYCLPPGTMRRVLAIKCVGIASTEGMINQFVE